MWISVDNTLKLGINLQVAAVARQPAPGGGRQAALNRMRAGMRQRLVARQAEEAGEGEDVEGDDVSDDGTARGSDSEDGVRGEARAQVRP